MKTISLNYALKNFREILSDVEKNNERIVIFRGKKKLAALVPFDEAQWLERREDEIDLRDARKGSREAKKYGTIPFKNVIKKLGLK